MEEKIDNIERLEGTHNAAISPTPTNCWHYAIRVDVLIDWMIHLGYCHIVISESFDNLFLEPSDYWFGLNFVTGRVDFEKVMIVKYKTAV